MLIQKSPYMGKMGCLFTKPGLYGHHGYTDRRVASVCPSLDKDISVLDVHESVLHDTTTKITNKMHYID